MSSRLVCFVSDTRSGTTVTGCTIEQNNENFIFIGEAFYPAVLGNPHGFFQFLSDRNVDAVSVFLNRREVISNYFDFLIEEYPGKILIIDIKAHDLTSFLCVPDGGNLNSLLVLDLLRRNATFIVLERSTFDAAVSEQLAAASGVFHVPLGSETEPKPRSVTIDVGSLVLSIRQRLANRRLIHQVLTEAKAPYEKVAYTDDVTVTLQEVKGIIARQIGIEIDVAVVSHAKVSTLVHIDNTADIDIVRACFNPSFPLQKQLTI